MKISIHSHFSLNEIGSRANNEDSIYPAKNTATTQDCLFMVCDGVGGNTRGEVASQLVCDSFTRYFRENPASQSTPEYLNAALEFVEKAFDDYFASHAEAKGMGSTLTLLHLHEGGATVAHIGDSRVYHVRKNEILFQTADHSLVNDLVQQGLLTLEDAAVHPHRNIINRAVQGASVKPTEIDTVCITDVRVDDYFFLCTDGILENIRNADLISVLVEQVSDEEKIKRILTLCEGKTRDNFSCYLIKIQDIEAGVSSGRLSQGVMEIIDVQIQPT